MRANQVDDHDGPRPGCAVMSLGVRGSGTPCDLTMDVA